ncbi:MAG: hypothetical protein HQL57_02500 [Magnetococcales bacterium]|nr:hypothetical protein [Magnetococcales bacterium]
MRRPRLRGRHSPRAARDPVETAVGQIPVELGIERLLPGGLGLGHHAGVTFLVPFTAPGDRIEMVVQRVGKGVGRGTMLSLLEPGPGRISPPCRHFGRCGGCQLLHLDPATQAAAKEGFVTDSLRRIGRLSPPSPPDPIVTPEPRLGYRRRAGIKIRWVGDRPLIGFFAANSHRVIDLEECPVLHPRLSRLLGPMRELVQGLDARRGVPQCDLLAGEAATGMVWHFLLTPDDQDRRRLLCFAEAQGVDQLWIQVGRRSGLQPLRAAAGLHYMVADLALAYGPGEFTQAHFEGNRLLVAEAMAMMQGACGPIGDLFSGIGNFTLPLAGAFPRVIGLESHPGAVARAGANARAHGLDPTFRQGDLAAPEVVAEMLEEIGEGAILMDPPREGAVVVARGLAASRVRRVISVACDPATFARDAAILVHGGFHLERLRLFDLFPGTHHVELAALFRRR